MARSRGAFWLFEPTISPAARTVTRPFSVFRVTMQGSFTITAPAGDQFGAKAARQSSFWPRRKPEQGRPALVESREPIRSRPQSFRGLLRAAQPVTSSR